MEEIKILLNMRETIGNNKCLNYNKNLSEILEEIVNKNKALNKIKEDELKNVIIALEKEKNEKDDHIKLLEKNIDELNNNYKAQSCPFSFLTHYFVAPSVLGSQHGKEQNIKDNRNVRTGNNGF